MITKQQDRNRQVRKTHALPISQGADCESCPLATLRQGPVASEIRPGSVLVIVENPSILEIKQAEWFPFRSEQAVFGSGLLRRSDSSIIPVVACRPNDKSSLADFEAKQETIAKSRGRTYHSPIACCAGRFRRDFERADPKAVVSLGSAALHAVAGVFSIHVGKQAKARKKGTTKAVANLSSQRGHPYRLPNGTWLYPTQHPSSTFKGGMRHLAHVVQDDLRKFADLIYRRARLWKRPIDRYVLEPTIETVEEICARMVREQSTVMVDSETAGLEYRPKIRTVQLGDAKQILVVPFRRKSGRWYWGSEDEKIRAALAVRSVLDGCPIEFQNGDGFDTIRLLNAGLMTDRLKTWFDCRPAMRNTMEGDAKRSLAHQSSRCLSVELWKNDVDHKAEDNAEKDRDLWIYGGDDVAIQQKCSRWIKGEIKKAGTEKVQAIDQALMPHIRNMSMMGLVVDMNRVDAADAKLTKAIDIMRAKLEKVTGIPGFNPNSSNQCKRFLFKTKGHKPILNSKGHEAGEGEESTSTPALFSLFDSLIETGQLDDQTKTFIDVLISYRSHCVLRSTFLDSWRKTGVKRKGWPDHLRLIRSTFVLDPPSGRLASGNPNNFQNIPKRAAVNLRKCIVPSPGHVFVTSDYEQLELRVFAIKIKDEFMLRAFRDGLKVHHLNAAGLFRGPGEDVMDVYHRILALPEKEQDGKKAVAKMVGFLLQYEGAKPKLFVAMKCFRDKENGLRPFDYVTRTDTDAWFDAYHEAHPNASRYAEWVHRTVRETGKISESRHGRTRHFPGGPNKKNDPINHPIQGEAAAYENDSYLGIVSDIPHWSWSDRTGLVNQVHDENVLEAPRERAKEGAEVLRSRMMFRDVKGSGVDIFGEPEIVEEWTGEDISEVL